MTRKSDLFVLSGKLKGAKIKSPQDSGTHPMGSRERLALFNMLQPYLEGAEVLDAYAGTGALGIEALSRGAKAVAFVEKSPQVAKLIRENLKNLGDGLDSAVETKSVGDFAGDSAQVGKYGLVLADPPYDRFDAQEVMKLAKLLKNGGILALSFPFRLGAPEIPGLELQTARKYATAGIALYCKIS